MASAAAAAAAPVSTVDVSELEQVPMHAFKKLGAVSVLPSLDADSPLSYHAESAHTSAVVAEAKSLLAVGRRIGYVFVVSPGVASDPRTHGFYYARAHDVLHAVEKDRAEQEADNQEKNKEAARQADLPINLSLIHI